MYVCMCALTDIRQDIHASASPSAVPHPLTSYSTLRLLCGAHIHSVHISVWSVNQAIPFLFRHISRGAMRDEARLRSSPGMCGCVAAVGAAGGAQSMGLLVDNPIESASQSRRLRAARKGGERFLRRATGLDCAGAAESGRCSG